MNAMALFSLYLYFFFTYFNIFSQLANHSLESMQRPRLFPAFFPRYFQSGAMISNNGGDISSNFFFRFFINHGCFASLQKWDIVPVKPV